MMRSLQSIIWIGLGVLLGLSLFAIWPEVHAYPEYTDRTGEQCTACHVNPAGGGPRTLRGLIWIAEGRPDEVPTLPGTDTAADADTLDGPALYVQFDCARCHGSVGEGDVAAALNQTEWSEAHLIDVLRNGVEGMKGYPQETMSDEALEAMIPYLQAMGRGEIAATVFLQKRALPPPQMGCADAAQDRPVVPNCGGN